MSLEVNSQYSPTAMRQQAVDILDRVGLGDRINDYPDELSEGQKQRVAIARALVKQPALVLADEPTAALDRKSGLGIFNLMQTLARERGCAILMVTHDNRSLDIADRLVYMKDGEMTTILSENRRP